MTSKRKFLIDCDAGVDDAQALILALSRDDIDIIAVTCVGGNINVDQVCINVMKVLELCKRTDIPVYKGATSSLINYHEEEVDGTNFHGKDGLGDADGIPDPDMSRLKPQHAVDTIIRLTAENPGEITLVALGPLTNIALACRMDPLFAAKLNNAVIMGGNSEAKGNDRRVCAEFNFHSDVEAAYVSLSELVCPTSIVTWETCLKHCFSWKFYDELCSHSSDKAIFLRKISKGTCDFYRKKRVGFGTMYTCCDLLAMAVAVCPDIVEKEVHVHATVELSGFHTRGQMVVDWRGHLEKEPNLMLIQDVNMEKFSMLAWNAQK